MKFKELSKGHSIYMLDRNTIEATEGRVVHINDPHLHTGTTDIVVDVKIEHDGGETKTYTFKADSEVGYVNSLMITPDKEHILREIEAIHNTATAEIAKRKDCEAKAEKCEQIKIDWSPALKEQKKTEERLDKMEQHITQISEMLHNFLEESKKKS